MLATTSNDTVLINNIAALNLDAVLASKGSVAELEADDSLHRTNFGLA